MFHLSHATDKSIEAIKRHHKIMHIKMLLKKIGKAFVTKIFLHPQEKYMEKIHMYEKLHNSD